MSHHHRVIIRLSSLGDVILASSALSTSLVGVNDWIVSQEYAPLLKGHPKIRSIFEFDRKLGFSEWRNLCRSIWTQNYDEVLDLHSSLRTRIMQFFFIYWGIRELKKGPKWKRIRKQRWKLSGYFIFKKLWPAFLRPKPWVERFGKTVGGSGSERPDLRHLIQDVSLYPQDLAKYSKYICVMPGSLWSGKKWPVLFYLQLLKKLPYIPVILGTSKDQESIDLVHQLKVEQIPHFSGVGQWNLKITALVLSRSEGYLGNDTGLAHLAEAVGVPANIIFGPTSPEMGFGPWQPQSKALAAPLWCRPCSKDGSTCFRISNRYLCLKRLTPDRVQSEILKANL